MMKLEKVVDLYGKSIGKRFIVKRQLLESETSIKAFKPYVITLYSFNTETNKFEEIIKEKKVEKFTESLRESIINEVEENILLRLFEYGNRSK